MSEHFKCDRCKSVFEPVMGIHNMHGDNVLNVKLSGGYSQFVDTEIEESPELYTDLKLCHKCGHDFMTGFMNIPADKYSCWHPNSGDDYCEGWSYA